MKLLIVLLLVLLYPLNNVKNIIILTLKQKVNSNLLIWKSPWHLPKSVIKICHFQNASNY